MKYEKGLFAFFDGTRSDYRKVLKQDDTIAGFKITSIEPSHVKLASATNEVELAVGKQLRREEEGEWRLSERPEVIEPVPAVVSARPTSDQGQSSNRTTEEVFGDAPPDLGRIVLPFGLGGPDNPFAADQGSGPGTNIQSTASSGGTDNESVLERLRRRREQQENQ
jgi:hypothetical protein